MEEMSALNSLAGISSNRPCKRAQEHGRKFLCPILDGHRRCGEVGSVWEAESQRSAGPALGCMGCAGEGDARP